MLAKFAEQFRSPEYFSLMLFGLVAAVVLATARSIKAVAMIVLGLLFGLVGTDTQSGVTRFTFGVPELYDGVDFVPVAVGLFGLAEIMSNLDRAATADHDRDDRQPVADARGNPARHSGGPARHRIGSFLGILPGGGAVLASFAAYTLEKKVSRYADEFGRGAVEGVAAPESANNAGAQTSFIPLLTLGIPSTPVMAMMMGAMTIQGIAPGTAIIKERPDAVLGHDRQHVDRQPDAGHHQPAADRHLGEAAQGALPDPVPEHPGVLLRRRLQHRQQHVPHHHDGRLRAARLRVSSSSAARARRSCSASCSGR